MENFKIPKKTYFLIPPGTYKAVIQGLEKDQGQYGPQVKWTFKVDTNGLENSDGETQITAWTSASYTEKSKLYRWARAAEGLNFNPEADFEAARIVGKEILVSVERKISPTGSEYNKITDVLALPRDKKTNPLTPANPDTSNSPDWDKN